MIIKQLNDIKDVTDRTAAKTKKHTPVVDFFVRLFREKPLGAVGGVIVLLMLLIGIFADVLAPYGYNELNLRDILTGPSDQYWLGTDSMGRDLLSRVIYGARVSIIIGVSVSFFSAVISSIIGVVSGFLGGNLDLMVQRFVDAWMAFPALLILMSVMSLVGPGLLQIIVVLSFTMGIGGSRIMRSAVIGIKENTYVEAGRAIGCSTSKLLIRHILPNIMAIIIVSSTTRMAGVILTEASLSFLGFGIPPPMPSWGGMLAERQNMVQAPWLSIWPGLALTIAVYGINMFGDAIRDLLDPRMRGGLGRFGRQTRKKIPANKS